MTFPSKYNSDSAVLASNRTEEVESISTKTLVIVNVTLHHEMSRNVPDGYFHVYFLKVNSMLFTMVKSIFKSEA